MSILKSSSSRRAILLAPLLLLLACGGEDAGPDPDENPEMAPILGVLTELAMDDAGRLKALPGGLEDGLLAPMAAAAAGSDPDAGITIDYPLDESVFPPDFLSPTFLWHDEEPCADQWLIRIEFSHEDARPITVLVAGESPPKGEIDLEAVSETNAPYEGTEYQNSAVSWTPSTPVWEEIKLRSIQAPATLTFAGFDSRDSDAPLSRGTVSITTSVDPVGAPFFYRDVPLMPSVGEHGRISPLGTKAIPIIAWRLRDVALTESKLVLKGMPACGNCHSFSLDGNTMGMDVDGPDGDKGMYAIKPVAKRMVIGSDDVITWNSFADKPEGHRTIGFMSRVSPDGRRVASTVNESLYVSNFKDFRLLQVFYPTRGILALHSRDDGTIRALPGADDTDFVHCSPAWSPDGETIVFSRAKAFDPFVPGMAVAKYSNDPNEPQVQYDLYRIPVNGGQGGKAVPVVGASGNGMSNTFPKISPDGKWIVWTKCRNGLLMRPDSRLWIVPIEGGTPRKMRCNTDFMNSWHSFSPNGRWLVFSSKSRSPYTQAFLTHIDEEGEDSPAIHVPDCTAPNRAVNLPEFLNAPFEALDTIEVPVVNHHVHMLEHHRHLEARRLPEAAATAERALEIEPTFVRALVQLGYTLMEMGRFEEALHYLGRASELDPQNILAMWNRGVSYTVTGRPHMAQRILAHLMEIAPGFPGGAEELALAVEKAKALDAAIAGIEERLGAGPDSAGTLAELGALCRSAGRLEDAVKHLGRVVDLCSDDPGVHEDLAWILAANRDDIVRDGERAVALAKRAVELTKGKLAGPHHVLAAALAETGRREEAIAAAERALVLAKSASDKRTAEIEFHLKLLRNGEPIRSAPDR